MSRVTRSPPTTNPARFDVTLSWLDRTLTVGAIIDSGADESFIDVTLAHSAAVPLITLESSLSISALDGHSLGPPHPSHGAAHHDHLWEPQRGGPVLPPAVSPSAPHPRSAVAGTPCPSHPLRGGADPQLEHGLLCPLSLRCSQGFTCTLVPSDSTRPFLGSEGLPRLGGGF